MLQSAIETSLMTLVYLQPV